MKKSPHLPYIIIIGEKQDYMTSDGKMIKKDDYSILARLFSMQEMHHAYAVTGALCTGAASKIPKSVVANLIKDQVKLILQVVIFDIFVIKFAFCFVC